MQRTIDRVIWTTASLVGAAAWFQPSVAGSDLWWHLAAGRDTIERGGPRTVDHFSFTFAGQPLHTPEWLWGAASWSIYRSSPDALAVVSLALLVLLFTVALAAAREHVRSPAAACFAIWAAAATCHWFLDIRPHVVTLVCVAIILATRHRWWARWLWAPLVAVWCNMHGGFVFGLGAIGLLAVVETGEASLAERRLRIDRTLWLGVALACLASLLNPWGWRIFAHPLEFLGQRSSFLDIVEWTPPPLDLDPRYYSGRFVWLLVAACGGAALELRGRVRAGRRGGEVYLVALAGVAGLMALTARRFIPLFAVTAVPLAAGLGAASIAWVGHRLPRRIAAFAGGASSAAALGVALLLWRDVRLLPRPFDRWTQSYSYPRAAMRYVRALSAGPRVMNYYNWGGYLMLHAPELEVMIDGRGNLLYSDEAYDDYRFLTSSAANFHARRDRYDPHVAMILSGRMATELAAPPYGWVPVYADGLATVLLPPGSPRLDRPLPDIEEVVGDEPQWLIARAAAFTTRGQPAQARALIERALARDPLFAPGYGALADSHARESNPEGVAAAVVRGLAAEPRHAGQLHHMATLAYMAANAPAQALEALERAIARGPFTQSPSARDVERLRAFVEAQHARR